MSWWTPEEGDKVLTHDDLLRAFKKMSEPRPPPVTILPASMRSKLPESIKKQLNPDPNGISTIRLPTPSPEMADKIVTDWCEANTRTAPMFGPPPIPTVMDVMFDRRLPT